MRKQRRGMKDMSKWRRETTGGTLRLSREKTADTSRGSKDGAAETDGEDDGREGRGWRV